MRVWCKLLSFVYRNECLTLRVALDIPKSLATFAQQPQIGFCYSRDMRFTLGRDFVFQKVLDPRCFTQLTKSFTYHICCITCFYNYYVIRYSRRSNDLLDHSKRPILLGTPIKLTVF
jgi:hypothetical protein